MKNINKATFKFLLKILFSIFVLTACFVLVDIELMFQTMKKIQFSYFLLALVLSIIGTIVLPAFLTQYALHIEKINLALKELISINFAMRFYVLVLPRAAAVGLRWYRYKKGGKGQDALALMIFERVSQLVVLLLTAVIFLGIERNELPFEGTMIWYVSFISLAASLFLFLTFISRNLSDIFGGLLRAIENFIPKFLYRKLYMLWEAVRAFLHLPRSNVAIVLVLSVLSYLLFIASPYIIVHMLELNISLLALAWIRSLVFLLTLAPVTVGGIGVREASFVAFLQLYGVPTYEALTFSLVLLAIQLAIGGVGAAIELWTHVLKSSKKSES